MNENKNLFIYMYSVIPTSLLSRLFGYITRINFPKFILNPIINWYIKKFEIKTDETDMPPGEFDNIDMFFTRKLKNGVHKFDTSKKSIVSPVDGRIDQFGKINDTAILQAKGVEYSLKDLIPSNTAERFNNGSFMTIYLSPSDYHRIHSPVSGKIDGFFNIPGKLYTVQEYMVKGYNRLFSINERIISYIVSEFGYVAVCKIGAMNVGRITVSYGKEITNLAFRKKREIFFSDENKKMIKKGDELGIFHLGSTVILLFQKDMMKFQDIEIGQKTRVGKRIGLFY